MPDPYGPIPKGGVIPSSALDTYKPIPERPTLRDSFAMAALQGLIASNDEGAGDRIDEIPEYAYLIADAMLEARKEK